MEAFEGQKWEARVDDSDDDDEILLDGWATLTVVKKDNPTQTNIRITSKYNMVSISSISNAWLLVKFMTFASMSNHFFRIRHLIFVIIGTRIVWEKFEELSKQF